MAAWRYLPAPGSELCLLNRTAHGCGLGGCLTRDEHGAWEIIYLVECGPDWMTRRAEVSWRRDGARGAMLLTRDTAGVWRVDGARRPDLAGCADVDLGFSPATNTLPVRRLGTPAAPTAVRAAWLKFPQLEIMVLEQEYGFAGDGAWDYASATGLRCRIAFDSHGLVTDYPGLWRRVGQSDQVEAGQ